MSRCVCILILAMAFCVTFVDGNALQPEICSLDVYTFLKYEAASLVYEYRRLEKDLTREQARDFLVKKVFSVTFGFIGRTMGCYGGWWLCGPTCAKVGKHVGHELGSHLGRPVAGATLWLYDNMMADTSLTVGNWITSENGQTGKLLEFEAEAILRKVVRLAEYHLDTDRKYLN